MTTLPLIALRKSLGVFVELSPCFGASIFRPHYPDGGSCPGLSSTPRTVYDQITLSCSPSAQSGWVVSGGAQKGGRGCSECGGSGRSRPGYGRTAGFGLTIGEEGAVLFSRPPPPSPSPLHPHTRYRLVSGTRPGTKLVSGGKRPSFPTPPPLLASHGLTCGGVASAKETEADKLPIGRIPASKVPPCLRRFPPAREAARSADLSPASLNQRFKGLGHRESGIAWVTRDPAPFEPRQRTAKEAPPRPRKGKSAPSLRHGRDGRGTDRPDPRHAPEGRRGRRPRRPAGGQGEPPQRGPGPWPSPTARRRGRADPRDAPPPTVRRAATAPTPRAGG